jgi:hypothetical protein
MPLILCSSSARTSSTLADQQEARCTLLDVIGRCGRIDPLAVEMYSVIFSDLAAPIFENLKIKYKIPY